MRRIYAAGCQIRWQNKEKGESQMDKASEWISVSNPPDTDRDVLIAYERYGGRQVSSYKTDSWGHSWWERLRGPIYPSHWQELPDSPPPPPIESIARKELHFEVKNLPLDSFIPVD